MSNEIRYDLLRSNVKGDRYRATMSISKGLPTIFSGTIIKDYGDGRVLISGNEFDGYRIINSEAII